MAPYSLLSLLAYTTLAVLSFSPLQVTSLSTSHDLLSRQPFRHSSLVARKKRTSGRCSTRSSSAAKASTTTTTKTQTAKASESTKSSEGKNNNDNNNNNNNNNNANNGDNNGDNNGGGGGGYSSSKKVGLAWPNGDDEAIKYYKTGKTGPVYSWSPWVTPLAKKYGFDPIPMFWGPKDIEDFKRLVVKGYAHAVLGFNEPNHEGQANISPEYGAELWSKYINPLKDQGYKLISPATTNAPSGKTWMKKFFAACKDCHFDAIAVHWYDTSADGFIEYVKDWHDTFGKQIWVTEFACQSFNGGPQCSKDQVFSFLDKVTKWMDSTSWVEHYFAFGVMHNMQDVNYDNQLMSSSGRPTDLGYMYIN